MLDARSAVAEAWVQRVAEESEQRVDWHYVAGRANVLYIGDYARVREAIEVLLPLLANNRRGRRTEARRKFPDDARGRRSNLSCLGPRALSVGRPPAGRCDRGHSLTNDAPAPERRHGGIFSPEAAMKNDVLEPNVELLASDARMTLARLRKLADKSPTAVTQNPLARETLMAANERALQELAPLARMT